MELKNIHINITDDNIMKLKNAIYEHNKQYYNNINELKEDIKEVEQELKKVNIKDRGYLESILKIRKKSLERSIEIKNKYEKELDSEVKNVINKLIMLNKMVEKDRDYTFDYFKSNSFYVVEIPKEDVKNYKENASKIANLITSENHYYDIINVSVKDGNIIKSINVLPPHIETLLKNNDDYKSLLCNLIQKSSNFGYGDKNDLSLYGNATTSNINDYLGNKFGRNNLSEIYGENENLNNFYNYVIKAVNSADLPLLKETDKSSLIDNYIEQLNLAKQGKTSIFSDYNEENLDVLLDAFNDIKGKENEILSNRSKIIDKIDEEHDIKYNDKDSLILNMINDVDMNGIVVPSFYKDTTKCGDTYLYFDINNQSFMKLNKYETENLSDNEESKVSSPEEIEEYLNDYIHYVENCKKNHEVYQYLPTDFESEIKEKGLVINKDSGQIFHRYEENNIEDFVYEEINPEFSTEYLNSENKAFEDIKDEIEKEEMKNIFKNQKNNEELYV